jgi:TonB family protein
MPGLDRHTQVMRDAVFEPLGRAPIAGPSDLREPTVDPSRTGGPAASFVRLVRRGLEKLVERHEPQVDAARAQAADAASIVHPVLSDWPRRSKRWIIAFAIVSLVLHLVLLLTARLWLYGGGDDDYRIPVQLVLEQPQPKPEEQQRQEQQQKQEQQKQEQQKPPPRGPLASDELGDPDATGKVPTPTRSPAAGEAQAKSGETPPPPTSSPAAADATQGARPKPVQEPSKSAAPRNFTDARQQLAAAGELAAPASSEGPQAEYSVASSAHPSAMQLLPVTPGGARRPTDRRDLPNHAEGHKAKYPGPDASRDEYLAYIRDLTDERYSLVPPSLYEQRQGVAVFEVEIRPNGTIVWFALTHSSGYSDADTAITNALNGIERFPPLPPELVEPADAPTRLTYSVPLSLIPSIVGRTR